MNTDPKVTRPRLAPVNRQQMVMRAIEVERLIERRSVARRSRNQTGPRAVRHIECRCVQSLYLRGRCMRSRKILAKKTRIYGIAMVE